MRYALKAARLQNPVLTNRKGIRGYKARISKPAIVKSQPHKTFYSIYHRHRKKEKSSYRGRSWELRDSQTKKSAEAILVVEYELL